MSGRGPRDRIPAPCDRDFVPALLRLANEQHVRLLIPTVSEEIPVLAMVAAIRPALGPRIEVPRSTLPSTMDESAAGWLGEVVVVKPRVGRGGRGVNLHRGRTARSAQRLDDSMIVQEFVPGTEYAPNLYLSAEREVAVVLEKTVLAHGIIGTARELRRRSVQEASDVVDVALRAARALGLTGPVDLDVRRRADGVPVVLDVNARFGLNSARAPEVLDALLRTLPDSHGGSRRRVGSVVAAAVPGNAGR